jgi:HD-GYP domain-containing protein (c-di-GMP phosphodiesterase class II)
MSREEMDMLQRRAERDRRAREQAERLLEEKARELYDTNERLRLATKGRLEALSRVGEDLSQLQDLDLLMSRILSEARTLTSAEAGSVFLIEGPTLVCAYSQNDRLQPGEGNVLTRLGPTDRLPLSMQSLAGSVALSGSVLNVPDAYAITPNANHAFDRRFDEATGYHTRAVLAIPLKVQGGAVMGVLQLINPIPTSIHRADVFDADDEMLMRHFGGVASLSIERARLTRSIITRMIRSVELRDRYETKEHASRVADISVELWEAYANRNNTHPKEIERSADRLRIAAMLHDVGKLGVSDVILQKPARLTPEEMAKVREHVIVGARLFDDVVTEFDRHARDVALYHHARWDGSGYPTVADLRQLQKDAPQAAGPMIDPRGENIPLFARIVALADVYDALVTPRAYKKAWSVAEALEAIRAEAGRQFDPELAELMPDVIHRREARIRTEAA